MHYKYVILLKKIFCAVIIIYIYIYIAKESHWKKTLDIQKLSTQIDLAYKRATNAQTMDF